jgi:hypothetical protein
MISLRFWLLGILAVAGCNCGLTTTQVATDVTAGLNFAVCVLGQFAQCEAASTPWPACSVNIVTACGGSALQVATVVDAYNAAKVKEGIVPKLTTGGR